MAKTPVTPKDPKVGYYVAGVEDDGDLIIQPFPKTGCCDDSSNDTAYVPIAGGTMTGPLILSGDPTVSVQAATKRYVDQKIAAGGGAGGTPTLPPVTDLPVVDIGPVTPGDSCPTDGAAKWDDATGQLYVCNNGVWEAVQDAWTPDTPPTVDIDDVNEGDSCPVEGAATMDRTTGVLYVCQNGVWTSVKNAMTPNAPPPIPIGATPPDSPNEGDTWYNTSDNFLYIYRDGSWQSIFAPSAPGQIGGAVLVVAALPALPDGRYPPGTVAFCSADSKLYENLNNVWTDITQALTPNAPNAVQVVSSRPALPNTNYLNGCVIFATDTNQLYKNVNGTWTVMTQQASIAAGSITAGMIQAGAIGTQQLAAGAITADKIAAGAIVAADIGAGSVTTDKLAANAVTAAKISAGAIGASQIAAGAITADKLAANSITAGKIAAGAIGASQIQAGVITADKFAANAILVGEAQIANASITTLKVAGEAINVIREAHFQSVQAWSSSGTALTLPIKLTANAKVIISFTGTGMYHAVPFIGNDKGAYQVNIDGVNNGGWYVGSVMSFTCMRALNAGDHTITVTYSGGVAGVECGNLSLVAHGALR